MIFMGEVSGVRRRLIDNGNASSQFGASQAEYEFVSDLDVWVTGHEGYNATAVRLVLPGEFRIGTRFKLTLEQQ